MPASKNINLRTSTFLDLAPDSSVIEQVVGASDELAVKLFLEALTETTRAFTFVVYAETIGDDKLLSKVKKEFAKELTSLFNE